MSRPSPARGQHRSTIAHGGGHQSETESSKDQTQACRRCNEKKTRCDKRWPTCSVCARRNVECVYTGAPRRRGPGKSKQHVQQLEERLRRMETMLQVQQQQHADASGSPSCSSQNTAQSSTAGSETLESPSALLGSASKGTETSALKQPDHGAIGPALPVSSSGVSAPPSSALAWFKDKVSNSLGKPGFIAKSRVRAYSTDEIAWFVAPLLDEINSQFPIFDVDRLVARIEDSAASQKQGPAWTTLVESIIARVTLVRAASDGIRRCYEMAWDFMASSLKRLPSLMLDNSAGTGADVIDALLSMAFFARGTADTKTTAMLVRCGLQAHWTLANDIVSATEVDEKTRDSAARKLWALYTIDQELSLNHGMPPAIRHHDIDTRLFPIEDHATSASRTPVHYRPRGLFWARVRLSIALADIHERLYSPDASLLNSEATLAHAHQLHEMLHALVLDICPTTASSIPRAGLESSVPPCFGLDSALTLGDVSVVSLHYAFCNASSMVYSAVARAPGLPGHTREQATRYCLAAARSTLMAPQASSPATLPDMWQLLVYPVAAALTLLDFLLNSPPGIATDVELIEDAKLVAQLEHHVRDTATAKGYPLDSLVAGCREASRLALLAAGDPDLRPVDAILVYEYRAYVVDKQKVRDTLSRVTHPIYVAQGLMGNLPTRDYLVARELAGLLLGEDYMTALPPHRAPFAPDILHFDAMASLAP
ncbi:hypothetical protein Micbo1qcDRAFT_221982 [Microdochium bolleyi]|uniref:Zn(2)-C6 fungal-type domain-containing protein n=1 Tax=Microdochium bolleyi TaxID=196109 RepID=A0A136ILQ0_9PEZI|nr:hypothetical protein Micbo1qcDRAFT_221982 [Microdochium bolleyi]